MRYRTLGRSGIEVSELSLGGVFISSQAVPYEYAEQNIHAAVDHGINLFDTAPGYHDSEEVLGRALASLGAAGQSVTIMTKIGSRHGSPIDPSNVDSLRACVEQSLRNLQREAIDVLLIHEADRDAPDAWWPDGPGQGPVIAVLDELKATGKVRFVGLAGTTAYEMSPLIRSDRFDVVLTAFQYSPLFREAANDLMPAAVAHSMGIVLGSPLMQGLFTARRDALVADPGTPINPLRREQFADLYRLLDEHGMSLPELALRFAISNDSFSSVLTGSVSAPQLQENIDAFDKGPLPDAVAAQLDTIHDRVPFRPYRERPEDPFLPPNQ